MAKDNKFGTFGGVYTPSVLTILGVIMYLRLPWVVGNAGLWVGLGIILVAHVISVSTGLSISSIATDKNVGAGGPYYIVSRSLGLPIGGTLGLALFVGLSFSISLYIIGFSESLLRLWDTPATLNDIRITGMITLVGLTIITLVSTAFAIKTQYLIFTLIALSLGSIFFGTPEPPATPALTQAENSKSIGELFGIFFPAVTGFTAGVNMSGDLQRPKQSIPKGTMWAIATGLVVYVGLAVFLVVRVPRAQLIDNPAVLSDIAALDWMVTGGIWGATLSSALGSILGAPRILQAISADAITPRWFAKGYGKSNEPRNALIVAFLIGASGILIGELDVIARIVSMVFLTTYGFLNISCAIESWASPDFRPDFKIPKSISLLGAATVLVVMIQLDISAMAGSVLLMAGLYAWLQRRQLKLESGDTWEGFWASLVRAGLYRLSRETQQHRNWRPNVLMFRSSERAGTEPLVAFANSLVAGNGLLTDFHLTRSGHPELEGSREDPPPVGVFRERVPTENSLETISSICRHHGFAGLKPNTVLLDWQEYRGRLAEVPKLLHDLSELDFNQLIYSEGAGARQDAAKRIDVWWQQDAGNLALALALVRFITSSQTYAHAAVRFLLLSDDSSNNDILRTRTRRILNEARVTAEIKVINNTLEGRRVTDWVERESADAALSLIGLPNQLGADEPARFRRLDELLGTLGPALLVKGSSSFVEPLSIGRAAPHSLVPKARPTRPIAEDLKLPENPQIRLRVTDLAERYERAVLGLHEQAIARLYAAQIELLRGVRAASERRSSEIERVLRDNPRRQRKQLHRVHSNFLQEVQKLVESFLENQLLEQRDALDGRIEAFLQNEDLEPRKPDELIWIRGEREQFLPHASDSRSLQNFKRWRRWIAFLKRSRPTYPVPAGQLESYYLHRLRREVLLDSVKRITSDCHQLAVHLGKRLNASEATLELWQGVNSEGDVRKIVAEQKRQSLEHLDELIAGEKSRSQKSRRRVIAKTRACLEDFANDLARLDIRRVSKRSRAVPKNALQLDIELRDAAEPWLANQKLLWERALLSLQISAFHHRLTAAVSRERESLHLDIESGLLRKFDAFLAQLERLSTQLAESNLAPSADELKLHFDYKASFDVGPIIERLIRETESFAQDLPESVGTLDNDSIERLEEQGSQANDVERIQLSVRPLIQFSVESNLIGVLEEGLEELPTAEQRASAVGHDVARLIAFQVTEFESDGDQKNEEFAAHMLPAIQNGIERLHAERARVRETTDRVLQILDQQLAKVLTHTTVYELATASDSLDEGLRRKRGRRAVTGVRGALFRMANTVRRSSVKALYRLTTGLVLARRLRERSSKVANTVEQIIGGVTAHSPRTEVVDELPYYYRQLFFGQATLNENFWSARDAEVETARTAIANFKQGSTGCLVIQGERGSGKSALWQHVGSRLLEGHPLYRVHPRVGGSTELSVFETALRDAVGQKGTAAELVARLTPGSVIILDDFELWWERSPNGMPVVDRVLELIDRFGDRCLFVLCLNRQAYQFLSKLRPLSDRALGVIECGIVSAETLKEIIMLRHGSTGVSFELEDKTEDTLSQWAVARLFAAHFHYSRGLVGPALQAWITHIHRVEKDRIVIRRPSAASLRSFDDLAVEHVAILLQLCLHKQLHLDRLIRLRTGPSKGTQQLVASLKRMGLISEPRPRVYEVNRFIHHLLTDRLRQQGLLS